MAFPSLPVFSTLCPVVLEAHAAADAQHACVIPRPAACSWGYCARWLEMHAGNFKPGSDIPAKETKQKEEKSVVS